MLELAWSDVTFYVVGSATAESLKSMPNSPYTPSRDKVLGSHTGNGEALAKFIVEHLAEPTEKKLLYLKGDKNRETLPDILNEHNIKWDGVQVYETRGSSSFKNDLEALTGSQAPFGLTGSLISLQRH
jgi:uroporphyrinogen-III synthase